MPTWKGVTPSGQMMPFSSWLASMIAPTRRDTPIPWEPMCTGTRLPSSVVASAPIGSEYFRAEIEDLADLDAARDRGGVPRGSARSGLVMGLVGAGIARGEFLEHGAALIVAVIVDIAVAEAQVGDSLS
jgi:hypothetical protein